MAFLTFTGTMNTRGRRGESVANGKARDHIGTDLGAGVPAISPAADSLARAVVKLMSLRERDHLYESLQWRVSRSPAASEWQATPPRFLSELDGSAAASIEAYLANVHQRMVKRARARGWEVEG